MTGECRMCGRASSNDVCAACLDVVTETDDELLVTPRCDEPQEDVCLGCGSLIDPTTCGCGDAITHAYDGHGPIPMGCDCLRHGEQYVEQMRITRMLVAKVRAHERKRIVKLLRKSARPRAGGASVVHESINNEVWQRIKALADELERE